MEKRTLISLMVVLFLGAGLVLSCGGGGSGGGDEGVATGTWTWVGGIGSANQFGVYGTQGVANPGNVPTTRRGGMTWEKDGLLWLMGGFGYNGTISGYVVSGSMNDLWSYDGTSWTWEGGMDTANHNGVYGTMGTANPLNWPGGRSSGIAWADTAGRINLFGGLGLGASGSQPQELNDLWQFESDQWTWIGGVDATAQPGVYGTAGVANPANWPGSRADSAWWVDSDGDLWMLGGEGYDRDGFKGYLNDLWVFDGSLWTWMGGSDLIDAAGSYGSQGIADSNNWPGAHTGAAFWQDSAGNFWIFGGFGLDAAGVTGRLNDLWKYEDGLWTWVNGQDAVKASGNYGTMGLADPANVPGARNSVAAWMGTDGSFLIYGGMGVDSAGSVGRLGDVWKFDGALWTWINGPDTVHHAPDWGALGVGDPANQPGTRFDTQQWSQGDGSILLFGGSGWFTNRNLGDLWRFDP